MLFNSDVKNKNQPAKLNISLFKGKRNRSKATVLVYLYHLKVKLGVDAGLPAWGLHQAAGVSYLYIKISLSKWHRLGYLLRKTKDNEVGRPVYYSISSKGMAYVERIPQQVLDEISESIRLHRRGLYSVKTIDKELGTA